MSGTIALHGGGEYGPGDEAAMDALLAAARAAAPAGETPRILIVPTAVARHRPELAVRHGERAFADAAARGRITVEIGVAGILGRGDALDPRVVGPLEAAHLVHFPGGDPDLIPTVLGGTPAWAAIRRALDGGACLAGASAGAMALAERCWTPDGHIDGLDLVHGYAVLPHFAPGRLAGWRSASGDGRQLAWLGLDEQTLVIGRPGEPWRVAGRGRVHVIGPDGAEPVSSGEGETIRLD